MGSTEMVGLALLYVFVGACIGIVGMGAGLFRAIEQMVREKSAALAEAADSKARATLYKTVVTSAETEFSRERERFRTQLSQRDSRIDRLLSQLQVMAERVATMRLNGNDTGDRYTEPAPFVEVTDSAIEPYSDGLEDFLENIESMEVKQHLEEYIALRRRAGIPDDEILTEIETGNV